MRIAECLHLNKLRRAEGPVNCEYSVQSRIRWRVSPILHQRQLLLSQPVWHSNTNLEDSLQIWTWQWSYTDSQMKRVGTMSTIIATEKLQPQFYFLIPHPQTSTVNVTRTYMTLHAHSTLYNINNK